MYDKAGMMSLLMEAIQKPLESVREHLLCGGITGSLDKDADLLCVIKYEDDIIHDVECLSKVSMAIQESIKTLEDMGFAVLPFTCFRTQVYLRHLLGAARPSRPLLLHILIYPGIEGMAKTEWPLVAKSMLSSLREIIPTEPKLLKAVDCLPLPPFRDRIVRYANLVAETHVIAASNRLPAFIARDEVRHILWYAVRYATAEYLHEHGRLSIAQIGFYRPSPEDLATHIDYGEAQMLLDLQGIGNRRQKEIDMLKVSAIAFRFITALLLEAGGISHTDFTSSVSPHQ